MFGYIKPLSPELKVKEQEAYRAVYCGLCRQLGKDYGQFLKMTLSYDFVFLAMLSISVKGEDISFERGRCLVHPLKKRNFCQSCGSLEIAAAAAVILLYHKLLDNISDGSVSEKTVCMAALPAAKSAYKKAKSKLPLMAEITEEQMALQADLEKRKCSSIGEASEPTAKILEAVLASLSDDVFQKKVLSRIGYLLGRWVYLIDALDDLDDDIKNDNYNPFRYSQNDDENPQEQAVASLYLTTAELIRTYDLLQVSHFEGILSNVFNLGLKNAVDCVLNKNK